MGFGGGLNFLEAARKEIAGKYPYWNATDGEDHVWLIAQDIGSCLTPVTFYNTIILQVCVKPFISNKIISLIP